MHRNHFTHFRQPEKVHIIDLSLSNRLDPDDLQENGLLVTDEEYRTLNSLLTENRRYTKKEVKQITGLSRDNSSKFAYSIVRNEQGLFAMYTGAKAGKALGTGVTGKVKLAQNLQSREWVAVKIQVQSPFAKRELKNLTALGLSQSGRMLTRSNSRSLLEYRKKMKRKVKSIERGQTAKNFETEEMNSEKVEPIEQNEFIMKLALGMEMRSFLDNEKYLIERQLEEEDPQRFRFLIPDILRLHTAMTIIRSCKDFFEKGFLHRDIKPGNIILDFNNLVATLIDVQFSIKMEEGGVITESTEGTPVYMPFELRKQLIRDWDLRNKKEKKKEDEEGDLECTSVESDTDMTLERIPFDETTELYALAITMAQFFRLFEYVENDGIYDLENKTYIVEKLPEDKRTYSLPEKQLQQILNLLHRITSRELTSFAQVQDQFLNILNEYKSENYSILRAAVFDVSKLDLDSMINFNCDPSSLTEFRKLWAELDAYDVVWLVSTAVDSQKSLDKRFLKLKNLLESNTLIVGEKEFDGPNLLVGDKLFVGSDIDRIKERLTKYLRKKSIFYEIESLEIESLLETQKHDRLGMK